MELKYLDGDEFAHWTDPASFATSWRNKRKRREWEVFNALRDGTVPDGVVELHAPAGVHIVDHVTHDWLPRAPRPLARRPPLTRDGRPTVRVGQVTPLRIPTAGTPA